MSTFAQIITTGKMKFTIQEYQPRWAAEFLQLHEKIGRALSGMQVAIAHIGSTAVPGLGAKPIIDILAGVEQEGDLDKTIAPMQQAGFTYFRKYEPAWPERRYFVQLESAQGEEAPAIIDVHDDDSFRRRFVSKAHVHTVVKGGSDWERHIAFRDYLRAHPAVRDEYYRLKQAISQRDFQDMLEYNDHKSDFVKRVERDALAWRRRR